jgi:hypothetical protein
MSELERQRVARIALDHAIRLQEEEPKPPPLSRLLNIKARATILISVAALFVMSSATIIH